jgi:tetratricopeptide (TPR) repeat protein
MEQRDLLEARSVLWALRLVALCACFSASAVAAQGDKGSDASFEAAMRKGRALFEHGDYLAAWDAFSAANHERPKDSDALVELAYAYYCVGNGEYAEKTAHEAVAQLPTTKRAAALCRLGLIFESDPMHPPEVGRKNAIAAFRECLAAAPNPIAKAHLDALTDDRAPMTPRFLAGPLPQLQAFCSTEAARLPCGCRSADFRCRLDPAVRTGEEQLVEVQRGSPYREIRIFSAACLGGNSTSYYLALSTEQGWFVTEEPILNVYLANHCSSGLKIVAAELHERAPQAGSELVLRVGDDRSCTRDGMRPESEAVTIVGVGPSGKPSAVGPITLYDSDDSVSPGTRRLALKLLPNGAISLRRVHGAEPTDAKAIGVHSLIFP